MINLSNTYSREKLEAIAEAKSRGLPIPPQIKTELEQTQLRQAQAATGAGEAEKLLLLEWTWKYRRLLAPGIKFDLEQHRYLEGIYQDECQQGVVCKAGQAGVSDYCISWMVHGADVKAANGLYIFPTDKHVSDFSASRIGPATEKRVSEYLYNLVKGDSDSKSVDNVTLKRIRDNFLFFRGGRVDPEGKADQLKSMPVDMLVVDEYDEVDPRAIPLAEARLEHSLIAAWRKISTPTYPEVGIHGEYLTTDQREWQVKCEHCGNWQTLELSDIVLEKDELDRPLVWHGGDKPFVACRKCSQVIDRTSPGEWVALYPSIPTHGYLVPGLACGRKNLFKIIGDTGLGSYEESKRKEATNQGLGLPYRSSGANALTESVLDACRRDYVLGAKSGGAFCGIDVGSALNVVIRGADWSLRYAGEHRNFDEALKELLLAHGVLVTVVDLEPETRAVRNFQAMLPRQAVWGCDYVTGKQEEQIAAIAWDLDNLIVKVDRTRVLDVSRSQFAKAAKGEPGATLPINIRDVVPNYYKHLKALERKIITNSKGNQEATYIRTGPDHYAHAESYACIAAEWYLNAVENQERVSYTPVRIGNY